MGRSPCCAKVGLNRGAWTALEDKILAAYIKAHGEGNWRNLPKRAGLKRCGKSCRLRWLNYLRPDIKRGNISRDEEELIVRLHKLLGNRWSLIAGRLPGRTDNEIKNYWNTNLGKKVRAQSSSPQSKQKPPIKSMTKDKPSNPPQLARPAGTHVIRTKATKCTKAVLLQSPPAPLPPGDQEIHPPLVQSDPPQTFLKNDYGDGSSFHCITGSDDRNQDFHGYNQDSHFLDFGFNDFQPSEGIAQALDNDDHNNNNLTCAGHLQLQQSNYKSADALMDNWGTNENNAILDLESLAFLLDSEDWL